MYILVSTMAVATSAFSPRFMRSTRHLASGASGASGHSGASGASGSTGGTDDYKYRFLDSTGIEGDNNNYSQNYTSTDVDMNF
jgi:hypothetical protein